MSTRTYDNMFVTRGIARFVRNAATRGGAIVALSLAAALSNATIISITSGDALLGSRSTNLVTNGSFEADNGTAANGSMWATGTTLTPQVSLTGWTATGKSFSYARWGNDISRNAIQLSDLLPDGKSGLYFGASIMTINVVPVFHPDGTVTFPSSPTFSPRPNYGPVTLSQTLTGLNTSQAYLLDFWASGENAEAAINSDGLFGLDITGESQMYFACPSGTLSILGPSQRYYVVFQPNTPNVTLTFTNWGHYGEPGGGIRTELVMDDVIVNPVPEPGTISALALPLLLLWLRRRPCRR